MGACLVQLGNNLRDRFTYAWYFPQPIFGYERPDRLGEECHAFAGPTVGLRPVGITSVQHGSATEFIEQPCYLGGI
jgi:hypothetical protein